MALVTLGTKKLHRGMQWMTKARDNADGGASEFAELTDTTVSTSDPAADSNPASGLGHIWENKTSGEMYVLTDATAGVNEWTNVGDGSGTIGGPPYMEATGGTITTDGNFKVHTFNSSGTFTVTNLGVQNDVSYLVIAGGGGGGYNDGGGGGAGGYLTASSVTLTEQAYAITVGAGGARGDVGTASGSGTNSLFGSLATAVGGGGGGGYGGGTNGQSGGSGGGAENGSGGAATSGQGNRGGNDSNLYNQGSGGGGAGGQGTDNGSTGGAGLTSSITGSSVGRAGGGGGGDRNDGGSASHGGGKGGGGNSSIAASAAGATNTGGGGGASAGQASNPSGQDNATKPGGSGVVIVRYQFQAA